MTSHRRNLFFTLGLGIYFFPSMIKRTFFFTPRYFYHYCNSNWQHNATTVCGHKQKIKISFNFYNSVLQCDLINQSRLLETSKKKTQHLKKLAKFYAHKSKKYRGKMGNNLSINLDIKSFWSKIFLKCTFFPLCSILLHLLILQLILLCWVILAA